MPFTPTHENALPRLPPRVKAPVPAPRKLASPSITPILTPPPVERSSKPVTARNYHAHAIYGNHAPIHKTEQFRPAAVPPQAQSFLSHRKVSKAPIYPHSSPSISPSIGGIQSLPQSQHAPALPPKKDIIGGPPPIPPKTFLQHNNQLNEIPLDIVQPERPKLPQKLAKQQSNQEPVESSPSISSYGSSRISPSPIASSDSDVIAKENMTPPKEKPKIECIHFGVV